MRLFLDEDSQSRILIRLLREAGHDVLSVNEAELSRSDDETVFALARTESRILLTRNVQDFFALHIRHTEHPGVLVEYMDANPNKNMSYEDIVRAITNIESSKWDITGQFVGLNAWNFLAK